MKFINRQTVVAFLLGIVLTTIPAYKYTNYKVAKVNKDVVDYAVQYRAFAVAFLMKAIPKINISDAQDYIDLLVYEAVKTTQLKEKAGLK